MSLRTAALTLCFVVQVSWCSDPEDVSADQPVVLLKNADPSLKAFEAQLGEVDSRFTHESRTNGYRSAFEAVRILLNDLRSQFGWVCPSQEAVSATADFIGDDTALSVASGSGLLESLLAEDVNIVATDADPPDVRFMDITKMSMVKAVRQCKDHNCLIISCPCLDTFNREREEPSDRDVNVSDIFEGTKIIYIGDANKIFTGQHPNPEIWAPESTTHAFSFLSMTEILWDGASVRFFRRQS